jgi:hypothetical protein
MSTHVASHQSDSDCDLSDNSEVSNFASPPQPLDMSPKCSSENAAPMSLASPTASRSHRGSARPSPNRDNISPAGKQSPRIFSPNPKFSPKGIELSAAPRSPKHHINAGLSLAAGASPTGLRSSPNVQQYAQHSDVDDNLHSRASSSVKLRDYLDDPLMTLCTNREHSDLVIRERDDEPHLRFMSLHFTPATPQAVAAFRSDWTEERDALLQDDVFMGNKRAVFFVCSLTNEACRVKA